jgi:hypothetical protein
MLARIQHPPTSASSSKRLLASGEATPTAAVMSLPAPEFIQNFS